MQYVRWVSWAGGSRDRVCWVSSPARRRGWGGRWGPAARWSRNGLRICRAGWHRMTHSCQPAEAAPARGCPEAGCRAWSGRASPARPPAVPWAFEGRWKFFIRRWNEQDSKATRRRREETLTISSLLATLSLIRRRQPSGMIVRSAAAAAAAAAPGSSPAISLCKQPKLDEMVSFVSNEWNQKYDHHQSTTNAERIKGCKKENAIKAGRRIKTWRSGQCKTKCWNLRAGIEGTGRTRRWVEWEGERWVGEQEH